MNNISKEKEFLVSIPTWFFFLSFFLSFFSQNTRYQKTQNNSIEFILLKATEKYSNKGLLEAQMKVYLVL
jgi:hypothetical protein